MIPAAFMVIAHRGASSYAPENTLAAFDLALDMGARQIELDLQSSQDGHIVVMHDDAVDRTTNGSGLVSNLSLAALRELDAGSWFDAAFGGQRIATFEEVLERYQGRAHLHAEIKGRMPVLVTRLADLVRRQGMADQVTVTSFQKNQLRGLRAYAPELETGWLIAAATDDIIAEAHELGVTQLCPKAGTLTPESVRRLQEEGFVVRAWGVATEVQMRQVVQAGADGMTVNFPDKLIAYLNSLALPWA